MPCILSLPKYVIYSQYITCVLYNKCIYSSVIKRHYIIERFHMTSQRPYWCSKTKKRRPCWCTKLNPWELNFIFMQIVFFCGVKLTWPLVTWVKLLYKLSYARILIGSHLWSIGGLTHRWWQRSNQVWQSRDSLNQSQFLDYVKVLFSCLSKWRNLK